MAGNSFFYIGVVVFFLAIGFGIFFFGLRAFGVETRRAVPYAFSLVCLCIIAFAVFLYFAMPG